MLTITDKNKIQKEVKVAVVVPAYNEEKLIAKTLTALPDFVDRVFVVDDKSKDKTAEIIRELQNKDFKIRLVSHEKNQGVGGAIATGYKESLKENIDVIVVVAGDAQMAPEDMINLAMPVATGEADYCKGNRLFTGESWKTIPHLRYLGNSLLSLLTKFASGYWHIADSQCGYTAISLHALKAINLDDIYKRYGMPNDLLIKLNIYDFKVRDVQVKPIYGQGEKSGIKLWKIIPAISLLLMKGFFKRLARKYIIRDFHPLVFFYGLALLLFVASILLFIRLVYFWVVLDFVPRTTALALMFAVIAGLQSSFFAMWFDMENNKNLK